MSHSPHACNVCHVQVPSPLPRQTGQTAPADPWHAPDPSLKKASINHTRQYVFLCAAGSGTPAHPGMITLACQLQFCRPGQRSSATGDRNQTRCTAHGDAITISAPCCNLQQPDDAHHT